VLRLALRLALVPEPEWAEARVLQRSALTAPQVQAPAPARAEAQQREQEQAAP
jgi:hypothetical protein